MSKRKNLKFKNNNKLGRTVIPQKKKSSTPKKRKQNRPIPMYRPNRVINQLTAKSTSEGMRVTTRLVVPASCYYYHTYVITLHPMFLDQRLLNYALNWTQYKINSATIILSPLVPTTDSTAIAIGYTTQCTPVTNTLADQWTEINTLQGTQGMAHTPLSYKIPSKDLAFHPMVPVVNTDIPFTFFVTSQTEATDLTTKVLIHLSLDITFRTQYTGSDYTNTLATDTPTFTLDANGTKCDSIEPVSFGFVDSSDITSIDLGELIQMPAMTAANTSYTTPFTHNGSPCDPKNIVGDRGSLHYVLKTLN